MRHVARSFHLLVLVGALLGARVQAAEPPVVVTSIAPIHSLIAAVLRDVAEPGLIVKGAGSPHGHAMRPSEAQMLARAEVVFWVGKDLEAFLARPIAALARTTRIVTLSQLPNLALFPVRTGAQWDDADDHRGGAEHGHRHARDMHIWLDPAIAIRIGEVATEILSKRDPGRRTIYAKNFARLRVDIENLDGELRAGLGAVRDKPYFVFHDAYQYFERRYGLAPAGAITLSPERAPSASRLAEVRHRLKARSGVCVFREPQFAPTHIATVIEGTGARVGVLDPIGAALAPGPDLWFALMRGLGRALAGCLG